jgi:hypothetical protein
MKLSRHSSEGGISENRQYKNQKIIPRTESRYKQPSIVYRVVLLAFSLLLATKVALYPIH